jgi:glycosyltransferase involved in cell wall biosynthesis
VFKLIGGLMRCWSLVRRDRFHVVESFTYDSNLLGLPLAWLAGVPVRIATHHGILEKMPRWRQRMHTWMINSGIASCLVVVTEQLRHQALAEGIHARRIVTIPNGIKLPDLKTDHTAELRKDLGIRSRDIFLLSVGRLTHQKAHSVLIQAMSTIIAQHPETILCIAGDGPLRQQLSDEIGASGLDDHVKLLGERDDIAQLMAAADIFILPSRSEGLPIAILEAMGAGRAVIATRTGGIDDVLEDGSNGLLVPADDPVELARAISRFIDDPAARSKMGEAARQSVIERHTLDRMCDQYLNLMKNFPLSG